jgi:hypothetical protein
MYVYSGPSNMTFVLKLLGQWARVYTAKYTPPPLKWGGGGGGKYQPMSLKVNNLKRKYDMKKNAKEKDG